MEFNKMTFEKMVEEEETRRELILLSEIEAEINEIFECSKVAEQVVKALQEARADGASIEDFYSEYLNEIKYCHCETGSCTWPLQSIVDSLKDISIVLEEYLSF